MGVGDGRQGIEHRAWSREHGAESRGTRKTKKKLTVNCEQ